MPEDTLIVSEVIDAGIVLLSSSRALVGIDLPAPNHSAGRDPLILWQSPRDWLFLTSAPQCIDVMTSLRRTLAGQTVLVNDMSDARLLFSISGPAARWVLAAGCGLDLTTETAPGWCARVRFANLAVTLFDRGETASFGLICERSYAAYMRRWFAEARHEFSTP